MALDEFTKIIFASINYIYVFFSFCYLFLFRKIVEKNPRVMIFNKTNHFITGLTTLVVMSAVQ